MAGALWWVRRLQETVRGQWPRIRIRDLSLACGDLVAYDVPLLSAVAICLAFQTPGSGSVFQEDHRQGQDQGWCWKLGDSDRYRAPFPSTFQMVGPPDAGTSLSEALCLCPSVGPSP